MIEGKTSTGFKFEIDEKAMDNMEFIDLLVDLEDTENEGKILLTTTKLIKLLLSEDMKKALYNHVRDKKTGRVPVKATTKEIMEIIAYKGSEQEDSEEVKNV